MQRTIVVLPANDDALAAHHAQVDIVEHMEFAVPFGHTHDIDRHVGLGDLHLAEVDVEILGGNPLSVAMPISLPVRQWVFGRSRATQPFIVIGVECGICGIVVDV